jgi:hypothetical protein
VQSVSRTISLHGAYVSTLGALLVALGVLLPVWSVLHHTLSEKAIIEIPSGPLRPAMIQLPQMTHGTIFAIAESEVTQAHFFRVMGGMPPSVGRSAVKLWKTCPAPFNRETFEIPVTCVTLSQAAEYANRLTKIENNQRTKKREAPLTLCYDEPSANLINPVCTGYRLPTAKEWIYAVKAKLHTSESDAHKEANDCRDADASHCADDQPEPRPARELMPNEWYVLYDSHGNTAEMVVSKDMNEPRGRVFGAFQKSIYFKAKDMPFDYSEINLGFRVVRDKK